MTVGRIAPFQGSVVTIDTIPAADSVIVETSAVDITDLTGIIVYDREMDGLYDDTLGFFGAADGYFSGVIEYRSPVNVSAAWITRTVEVALPELRIDTFLEVEAHLRDQSERIDVVEWEPLVAQRPVEQP
ncbi:MAG TPA: hypothetical protein VLB27_06415 [candidate division Zixibacteria bacterium]|nr:hypothetical protein [candidate division Zixibacteria bacterium]